MACTLDLAYQCVKVPLFNRMVPYPVHYGSLCNEELEHVTHPYQISFTVEKP